MGQSGLKSVWFPPFYFTRVHTCMHTDRSGSNRSLLKHKAPLILDSFWYSGGFLHHQTPLSLYLFLQTGSGEGLAEKKERSEVEKQNKFSDIMPEAERLCRRTGSPSSSCPTDGKIFQTPSEAEGIPANREEGRRRRCQSKHDTERLICPRVQICIYNLWLLEGLWVTWQYNLCLRSETTYCRCLKQPIQPNCIQPAVC